MTIVSKSMRNVVELYRATTFGQKYLLPQIPLHSVIAQEQKDEYCLQFERLGTVHLNFEDNIVLWEFLLRIIIFFCYIWYVGLLMKRSTCLYSTKYRLNFMEHFLQKVW